VYRSNLLGADLRITNYAGGNTSSKIASIDPVSGRTRDVLWVKGSGGDLGTLQRTGLAVLDVERVRSLENGYRGWEFEDDELALLPSCVVEASGAAPSIDTPLHALVPFPEVDHVHPDALIAFACAADGAALVKEVFGDDVGWLDYQRPGFDLGIRLRNILRDRPTLRGVVLGGHGLICWADTGKACYENTLELIEISGNGIEAAAKSKPKAVFGGAAVDPLGAEDRRQQAARMFAVLRGMASTQRSVIGHYRDDAVVLEFIDSQDAPRLAAEGTSCPDHFLRTKRRPLLLALPADADVEASRGVIAAAFDAYGEEYEQYYRRYAPPESVPMRSPNPVVVLWPGIGMFTLAANKREARIAGEFYVNAINVMRGAETLSRYRGIAELETFRCEYWSLEAAKLKRLPPEKPLSRRVALITGGAGGIGGAIARRFAAEGASVVIADVDLERASTLAGELGEQALGLRLDITDEAAVERAFGDAILAFGGVDILINNAGVVVAGSALQTSLDDYERMHRVIDLGSFLMSRSFARHVKASGIAGDIVYIVSKNAVFAGPENVAYGAAKAGQLHQMRLMAVDLAELGIRVNAVNPDAVIRGSNLMSGDWKQQRAAKYGVDPDKLGDYYAQRTLLKQEILPEDVASACFALVGGDLSKTTGMVIPVDGGIPAAFVR
jgi:rhamnulose-1-phosphate aldolase/alcohol dehydrogenase